MNDMPPKHRVPKALTALRVAEDSYRLVMRATEDVVWDYDLAAGTVRWNEALTRHFGHAPDSLETSIQWWESNIHPDDRPRVLDSITGVIEGGGDFWAEEYRLRRANGSWADVVDRGYVIRDRCGRGVRMVGAILDQSERRAADAALRASEERLRLAQEAAGLGTFEWDLERLEMVVNDRALALGGLPPGERRLPPERLLQVVHPDDRAIVADALNRVANGEGIGRYEYRVIRESDGELRWLCSTARSFYGAHGGVTRRIGVIEDITDRKLAETRLRQSEERLRLAQEAAGLGTFDWDLVAATATVSDTYRRILGYGPGQGASLEEIFAVTHPDDRHIVEARAAAVTAGQVDTPIEFRIRRADDGGLRWVRITARNLDDAQGQPVRRIGVLEDITDRREAEARLRESEARFRHLADHAPMMVWVTEADSQTSFLSQSWYEYTGQTPESALGRGWTAALHPDDRGEVGAAFVRYAAERKPFEIEFRLLRHDGEWRWVYDTARPRFAEDGAFLGYVGSLLDITARKEAEARLRESEENYRYTVELSPQLAWTADPDGSNIHFKRPFSDFTGLAEPEAGPDWTDQLTHPDDLGLRRRAWQEAIAKGQPYDIEFRVRMLDGGYRWVRSRGWPRHDEAGRIIRWYGVTEDIDDRKRAEQKLQRLQDELSQVARASAMGTLATTLAHELNQPLTTLTNYMAGGKRLLVQHGAEALPVLGEVLDEAARAATQAGEIVRRLRDLVGKGKVTTQPVDLDKLISGACELALGDLRGRSIGLSLQLEAAVHQVLADRIQIQQVLVNLLRNAAEAMDGSVTRVVTIATAATDEHVTVRVEDTGPGVSPEVKRHIFSPFVSTKASGMGVGLSICRSIIEAHGGQLWVEDTPDGGAAFCFTLKAAAAGEA